MSERHDHESLPAVLGRRQLLRLGLIVPAGAALAACTSDGGSGRSDSAGPSAGPLPSGTLPPTPECADDDEETPEQTEGPYFSTGSPERTDLRESGMAGTPLVLTGAVLTTDCRPVAKALLEFWQADDAGEYDNSGFRLRGHQFSRADGTFELRTIVPGLYPGRTRHIHVKVQPPNGSVLTTQLYFPGERANGSDGIFSEELVLRGYHERDGGHAGTFAFVT
jgi:protocatechuate 3,4-dioxygenase beta subunit